MKCETCTRDNKPTAFTSMRPSVFYSPDGTERTVTHICEGCGEPQRLHERGKRLPDGSWQNEMSVARRD
jgi:hypothetical protein